MSFLLDTQAIIYFINGDNRLPKRSRDIIRNPANACFISIASVWEIAIKTSLNKLALRHDLVAMKKLLNDNQIEILPVNYHHPIQLSKLKYHHRDPFDRIIIAQAINEKLKV